METIHHIKTGGTIGGCVPEYKEVEILNDVFNDVVNLDKYLNHSMKLLGRYTEKDVCHKDSRDINDQDRAAIVATIEAQFGNGTKKFLVTHGTYTMPETGKYIVEYLNEAAKKSVQVLITGSMFPWSIIGSDAPLNIGATIGLLMNTDTPGVFICMHGKLFDPYHIKKDAKNLIFHEE